MLELSKQLKEHNEAVGRAVEHESKMVELVGRIEHNMRKKPNYHFNRIQAHLVNEKYKIEYDKREKELIRRQTRQKDYLLEPIESAKQMEASD